MGFGSSVGGKLLGSYLIRGANTPVGGIVTLVYDTFTDTNGTSLDAHTPDIDTVGNGWSDQFSILNTPGDTDISGNVVTCSTPNIGNDIGGSYIDSGQSDVIITGDVSTTDNTGASTRQGLLGRLQDTSNYWQFLVDVANNEVTIYEIATQRASTAKTINPSTTYSFTITLNGTSLTLNVDGTEASYTSSSYQTETDHGVIIYDRSSFVSSTVDDFTVTTLS